MRLPGDDLVQRAAIHAAGRGSAVRGRPGRTITMLAVGFLALDGVLLLMAGLWSGRVALLVWGVAFGLAAVAVLLYWRRYLRQLREISEGLEARFRELMQMHEDVGGPGDD